MARKSITTSFNPNAEIKLAVARWTIETGRPQYELAEMLGIKPCNLSRMLSGGRSGKTYVRKIYDLISPRKVS